MRQQLNFNHSFTRFCVFSLIVFCVIFTQNAAAEGILDTVNSAAAAATGGWMEKALGLAKTLFFGLAGLEFAWSAIQLTLKKSELTDIAVSTLFKVMNLAFFAMILIKAPDWIPAIMDSFKQAGAQVSGAQLLTPSGVISRGIDLAGNLVSRGQELNSDQNGHFWELGDWTLAAMVIGLSGLMVIIGFAVVAIQLFVALVESYIVIGGGALMLGFLGSRWTINFGEKFFSYAVSVGVKLFSMYLLVGLGDTFFQAMDQQLTTLASSEKGIGFSDWLGMGGTSLVYGGLGYMVPGIASSMLNGAASMSMSNLGAASGALAAAPVAGALAGGAALAQGAGYGAGLMNLAKTKDAAGAIGGSPPGGGSSGSVSGGVKSGSSFPGPAGRRSGSSSSGSTSNGFASSDSGNSTPRNMTGGQTSSSGSGDQSSRDVGKGGGRSETSLSDKLFNKARELQYQSDRKSPGLVHDGNQGSGINVRLGHHED